MESHVRRLCHSVDELKLGHLHAKEEELQELVAADHKDVHDRENHPVLVNDLFHKTLENPSWEKILRTATPTAACRTNTLPRNPLLGLLGAALG